MIAALAEVFEFREDWHRQDRALPLVRQYEQELTSLLETHGALRDRLVGCCHCGLAFLTQPCNRGRRDLRCPFGCRAHYRRQQANARSRRHYATAQGRRHKKHRNGQRSLATVVCPAASPPPTCHAEPTESCQGSAPEAPTQHALPPAVELPDSAPLPVRWSCTVGGVVFTHQTLRHSPVFAYLCLVAQLLERRVIGREELFRQLVESLRQRSLGARPRREYVLEYLNQHPPP